MSGDLEGVKSNVFMQDVALNISINMNIRMNEVGRRPRNEIVVTPLYSLRAWLRHPSIMMTRS